jgi:His/Glu/Gln/Arg/opine family amino acid ABC transporter permease subunit
VRFDVQTFWDVLLSGVFIAPMLTTVWVTFAAMAIGIAIGLVAGLGAGSRVAPVRWLVRVYVTVFRGVPALVQIVFWYDAVAELTGNAINLPALTAGVVALGCNEGAYMTEIVRAGLESVDRGQREAAQTLGLSRAQVQRLVVIPQALRIIVPPTGNQVIGMMKTTSLLFTIGVPEIFATGTNIYSINYRYFEVLSVVSLWYLALTGILSLVQAWLERRFGAAFARDQGQGAMQRILGIGGKLRVGANTA